ncbi:MAG TPA: hypothetical protein VM680_15570, partial [Verrucomicrobiae bacterium]|nr:hypothetical protein [Verrucomicrobiae bacterium]
LATDVEENRVLDYVTFDNLVTKVDLDEAMRESLNAGNEVGGAGFNPALMWSKEPAVKGDSSGVSFGIVKQIEASLGVQPLSEAQWKDYSAPVANIQDEIQKFQLFMYGTNNGAMNTATAAQVPFSPSRNLYLVSAYQANDPLVHYMSEDLRDRRRTTRPLILRLTQRAENAEIGKRNTFRQSIRWDKGEKGHGVEFQDPHVYESDDWQFPIAKLDGPGAYGITNFHYRYPNIGALGQIHRGTPWQTVYLKSRLPVNLDPTTTTSATWVDWAGSYGTSPETDRKLIGLFTTAMSENAARGLLSVNQTNTAAWSAVLSGVPVVTNSWRNNEIRNNWKTPKFGVGNNGDDLLIQPNSPQMAAIVKGINDYRATRPLGLFGYLGEILGTPQLSIGPNWPNNNGIYASPFLNLQQNQVVDNNKIPDYAAFTDEAIEAIPARILSLLKEDEPRVTIYCFGQTLKPAPRSLVTSADYYNLCANYQVTGEYVTKSIVRVEGDIDARDIAIENDKNITDAQRQAWKLQRRPLKTVVESFDVLPPFE